MTEHNLRACPGGMLRLATPGDLDQVAGTLADAFTDYAWTNWTVPRAGRWNRVQSLQRLYVEHIAIPHGMVSMSGKAEAVAVFVPSEMPDLGDWFWDTVRELHGERFSRVMAAEALLRPVRPLHQWVLAAAGVAPDSQGRGLGTRVIQAGLDQLDSLGADCLLETSSEQNVRFYRRLGWREVAMVDTGGPSVWTMYRAAAKGAGVPASAR